MYIQSNEIHNVASLIKLFNLALRLQLYMFRTATVHPQELLCRKCMCRLWYVVIRVQQYAYYSTHQSLQIQLVQNAPDDGPMRSETCRAVTKVLNKKLN